MSSDHHDPLLAHHFDDMEQQFDTNKFGMWVFLLTEILFFSGLFVAYAVYRSNHPEVFQYASQFLDTNLGALNTIVLLLSSFTAAWAVRAAQLGQKSLVTKLLGVTVLCAFGFMAIKAYEYNHKFEEGLLWGGAEHSVFKADISEVDAAPAGHNPHWDEIKARDPEFRRQVGTFFGIYFCLTGLHGIHVIIGIIVILWLMRRNMRGDFTPQKYDAIDLGALYWHLVDLIWIFLFPLLYLIS
jgi:cytochrome c oxidase subunit III